MPAGLEKQGRKPSFRDMVFSQPRVAQAKKGLRPYFSALFFLSQ